MASKRGRKIIRKQRIFTTDEIGMAFSAAMRLEDTWNSPEGPAVVKDVDCLIGGLYRITYRVISTWGKEAWQ